MQKAQKNVFRTRKLKSRLWTRIIACCTALIIISGCSATPGKNAETSGEKNSENPTPGVRYEEWVIDAPDNSNSELPLPEVPSEPAEQHLAWTPSDIPKLTDSLELPVVGATGFASVELYLWADLPEGNSGKLSSMQAIGSTPQSGVMRAVAKLLPGTAFTILQESGDWWMVRTEDNADNRVGWVEHRYCLINLPDVVPSMIYKNTNSYASAFRTSGKDIPGITDERLYDAIKYNPRLGKDQFLVPVLYAMAKKVCLAQQNALAEGYSLVLYEGFRPYDTQFEITSTISVLANEDPDVRRGITTAPWDVSWFIPTEASHHQQGYAIDVSLAKITDAEIQTLSGYSFVNVLNYEDCTMPTPIHELSIVAATYTRPVTILSETAWRSATMSATMAANEPAKALQRYCTTANLTPLASAWWHFNDLDAYQQISGNLSKGNFFIETCASLPAELIAY